MLRAVARYLRQAGTTFSDRYVEDALVAHPRRRGPADRAVPRALRPRAGRRARGRERGRAALEQAIDAVESLDQDRILRSFLAVIQAMLRTNYFQPDSDGAIKPYLSFKLDPAALPWLPAAAARSSRSSSTRRARRACTCAAAGWRAAACAGRTAARTSAPRSWA